MHLTLPLLSAVGIVPWPTAAAAEYLREGDQASAVLFGLAMLLLPGAFAVRRPHLARRRHLVAEGHAGRLDAAARRSLRRPSLHAAGAAVAVLSAWAAFAILAAAAAHYAVSGAAARAAPATG